MSHNLSDKEQVQIIKDWWKKNGKIVLLGIVLFLVANTSIIFIKNYIAKYKTNASIAYTQLIAAEATNNISDLKLFANELTQKYKRSVYAGLGMLMLAKNDVVSGNLDTASSDLKWVIDKTYNKSIRQIARLRLARILLAQNKPQEASEVLKKIDDKSFNIAIAELNGDIALVLNNKDAAARIYQQALIDSENTKNKSPLLHMKANM